MGNSLTPLHASPLELILHPGKYLTLQVVIYKAFGMSRQCIFLPAYTQDEEAGLQLHKRDTKPLFTSNTKLDSLEMSLCDK